MAQKSKFLLASGAVCVLALTACGGGGGDGGEQSAAPKEAPTDYTTETLESTLAATTVGGEQLEDVGTATEMMEESGGDTQGTIDLLEGVLSSAEVDPAECKDPLFGAMTSGLMDADGMSDRLDETVGADTAEDQVVTARPAESKDAADKEIQDLKSIHEKCSEYTMTIMGQDMDVKTVTEETDVEGAGGALLQKTTMSMEDEEQLFNTSTMSVGNVVVSVSNEPETVSGDESASPSATSNDDLKTALDDIAASLVDGPKEAPSDSASPSES